MQHKSIEERMEDDLLDKQKNLFQNQKKVSEFFSRPDLGGVSEEELLQSLKDANNKNKYEPIFDMNDFVHGFYLKILNLTELHPNDQELGYEVRKFVNNNG